MKKSIIDKLVIMAIVFAFARFDKVTANDEPKFAKGFSVVEADNDDDEDVVQDGDADDDDEADVDSVRKFYKKNYPELFKKIDFYLSEWENTDRMTEPLETIIDVYMQISDLDDDDPGFVKSYKKTGKLELTSVLLGQEIRRLVKNKVSKTITTAKIKELKEMLGLLFEEKLELERKEIENYEKDIAKMQERFKKRSEKKERIIQKRFEELIGDDDDIEW